MITSYKYLITSQKRIYTRVRRFRQARYNTKTSEEFPTSKIQIKQKIFFNTTRKRDKHTRRLKVIAENKG